MVFSSLTFLCFFFPAVVILYFVLPFRSYRNIILLIASLLFYSWGEPKYIVLMLLSSLVAYIGGLIIEPLYVKKHMAARKIVFIITVVLLTLNLIIFKYLNFFVDNVNYFTSLQISIPQIVLPIGISFYTFQILSYVIDLYRREIKVQKNFFYLTLYVSFFPQLIAGPIVRYQTIEDEILNRKESWQGVTEGFQRFVVGLAKKAIIANNVALLGQIVYAGDPEIYGTSMYWIASLSYAFQIYFDFSGYSDMAIGLGRMFGFHFLENFNYPYMSNSINDFWRRWHISLSTWFRDYIYIPLGGNRTKKWRWILNIIIVWCLTGFWHGAQWNFMIWGLYYAALLLMEKLFLNKFLDKIPGFIRWIYAFVLVNVGWVFFNLTDFSQIMFTLKMMFTYHHTDYLSMVAANTDILYGFIYLPLAFLFSFPVVKKVNIKNETVATIVKTASCFVLLALSVMFILSSSYNPFIYFRF